MAKSDPDTSAAPATDAAPDTAPGMAPDPARADARPAGRRFQPYRLARLLLLVASICVSFWVLALLARLVLGS